MNFFVDQGPVALLAGFILFHVLADFPLQGAYLSKQKCRCSAENRGDWIVALSAHCIIQAGGVWFVSGSLVYAAVELVLHALIDTGKCQGRYGLAMDQILHIASKIVYVIIIIAFPW